MPKTAIYFLFKLTGEQASILLIESGTEQRRFNRIVAFKTGFAPAQVWYVRYSMLGRNINNRVPHHCSLVNLESGL